LLHFARPKQPYMHYTIQHKNFQTLLTLYSEEIGKLNEKLLNGESWDNLHITTEDITQLAVAIHQLQSSSGSAAPRRGNPAEYPPQQYRVCLHPLR